MGCARGEQTPIERRAFKPKPTVQVIINGQISPRGKGRAALQQRWCCGRITRNFPGEQRWRATSPATRGHHVASVSSPFFCRHVTASPYPLLKKRPSYNFGNPLDSTGQVHSTKPFCYNIPRPHSCPVRCAVVCSFVCLQTAPVRLANGNMVGKKKCTQQKNPTFQ